MAAMLVVAVALAAGGARPARADGKRVEPCPFRDGGTVKYEEETSCGAGGFCSTEWTAKIDGLEIGDEGYGLSPVRVQCAPGEVVLASERGDAGPIRLELDEASGVFHLSPEVRRRIEEVSRMPAGASSIEAARRLVMGMSYVPAVAGSSLYEAALVLARSQLVTGDWSGAEHTLSTWVNPTPDADWKRRHRELVASVEKAKSRAAPLHGMLRRLGTIPRKPVTPPFESPTLFWRAAALCVVQDDTPDRMRCYDVQRGQWGPLETTARPASIPLVLTGSGTICGSADYYSVRGFETAPPSGCGQFRADEIIGAAPGPSVLLDRGGLQVWTPSATKSATPAEASRIALESAGSRLVGGKYVLLDGVRYRRVGQPAPVWSLSEGRPKQDQDWFAIPGLASPDQRWVVAMSVSQEHPSSSIMTLWLLSIRQP